MPSHALQRLAPRDEGREQQVAERPVLEEQRPQHLALDRDVAQRLRDDRRQEHGLPGEQVQLAEEARRAVADDLVARGVEDRDLALEDRDERIAPVADAGRGRRRRPPCAPRRARRASRADADESGGLAGAATSEEPSRGRAQLVPPGPRAPGLGGDDERDGGDDARRKSRRCDCEPEVRDRRAREHGGNRQRRVRDDVERGDDRRTVGGRDRRRPAPAARRGTRHRSRRRRRASRPGRRGPSRSAAATTISRMPAASASEPARRRATVAIRLVRNWAMPAAAASTTIPMPAAITFVVLEELAPRAAGRARRRARRSTRRRALRASEHERTARRRRDARALRPSAGSAAARRTGSGMRYAPTRRARRGRAGRRRAERAARRRAGRASEETRMPRPSPPAAGEAVGQADGGRVAARMEVEQRGARPR